MNELFLQRLNKALDSLGFPVERGRNSEFVKRTGYSASQASGILAGKTRIADETMDRLEHRLGIRREWILTGEGEMFLAAKKEGAESLLSPEERMALEVWRNSSHVMTIYEFAGAVYEKVDKKVKAECSSAQAPGQHPGKDQGA